ncbi:MAG: hypothetical protein QNJ07_15415 [Woeseiaceae bacterium]|nr:hypothetical protein [Woeseiaceae bacterium]
MRSFRYLLVSTLLLIMATATASQPVREFSGRQSSVTAEFTVEAPWILDWRLNGDYEQMIALDVQLLNARTGIMVGRVLHTKRRGNGVKLFNESGTYKFRVSSTLANWTLRVEQLTEEEAELYTPKRRSLIN